jgi:ankyrin repeat protein
MSASLFDAIRSGDAAEVQRVIDQDPEGATARNADGASAVLWAIYTRHPELVPALLGNREPDLFEACALGRRDRVEALLAQDASRKGSFSADGFSALGLAVFFGHTEIARLLVDGADVNACSRNAFRVSPLHSAVASGKPELVELLLANGARPDSAEFLEMTPLHSAAASGRAEMVQQLLKAGADPRRKSKEGKTAAEMARERGHAELAAVIENAA